MRKMLYTLSSLIGLSAFAVAQSINFQNYRLPNAQSDRYIVATPGTFSVASTGSNQVWDYSGVGALRNDSVPYFSAVDSTNGYPDVHTFVYRPLVSPTGAPINSYLFYNIDASGFYNAADFTEPFSESLAAATGGANDALVIPGQRNTFNNGVYALKFPVTNQSSWTGSQNRFLNFNLTIAAYGLSGVPGYFKATESETRTVVGDGNLIIKDENGNAMPPIPVFMINVISTTVDSIYLGGAPAPAALMNAFGLTQGVTFIERFVVFYDQNGTGLPIASYTLDANNNPQFMTYRPSAARTALGIGLAENQAQNLNVYPNPVQAGSRLILSFENQTKAYGYSLFTTGGIKVQSGKIDGQQILDIPAHTKSGLYILSLQDQNGLPLTQTKVQVQ